jgi:uncharacterized membrane protein YphA (DoxX/SURF4 family)
MEHFLTVLFAGIGHLTVAQTVLRIAVGMFFAISGFHKLFNSKRHATFVETLRRCGVPCIAYMQWFVPCVEFLGGMSLIVGLLAPLGAAGLMCICLVAICTDGIGRIAGWAPIDRCDALDDILYLPEVLYVLVLMTIVTGGAGPISIDAMILQIAFQ